MRVVGGDGWWWWWCDLMEKSFALGAAWIPIWCSIFYRSFFPYKVFPLAKWKYPAFLTIHHQGVSPYPGKFLVQSSYWCRQKKQGGLLAIWDAKKKKIMCVCLRDPSLQLIRVTHIDKSRVILSITLLLIVLSRCGCLFLFFHHINCVYVHWQPCLRLMYKSNQFEWHGSHIFFLLQCACENTRCYLFVHKTPNLGGFTFIYILHFNQSKKVLVHSIWDSFSIQIHAKFMAIRTEQTNRSSMVEYHCPLQYSTVLYNSAV